MPVRVRLSSVDFPAAKTREGARILDLMLPFIHVGALKGPGGGVVLEFELPLVIFDQLCLWDAASEDREEDDPGERSGTGELDNTG
jgi:hypothetical protein